jgi:hypothetical protein
MRTLQAEVVKRAITREEPPQDAQLSASSDGGSSICGRQQVATLFPSIVGRSNGFFAGTGDDVSGKTTEPPCNGAA